MLRHRGVAESAVRVVVHRRRPGREVRFPGAGAPGADELVLERAAAEHEVVGRGTGHLGEDRLERRRPLRDGLVLGHARVGAALHADVAVRPRLGRDPLDDVVRVGRLFDGEGAVVDAEGRSRAACVGDRDGVAAVQHVLEHRIAFGLREDPDVALLVLDLEGAGVAGVVEDRRQGFRRLDAVCRRDEVVDRDADAVRHRHVDGVAVGAVVGRFPRVGAEACLLAAGWEIAAGRRAGERRGDEGRYGKRGGEKGGGRRVADLRCHRVHPWKVVARRARLP